MLWLSHILSIYTDKSIIFWEFVWSDAKARQQQHEWEGKIWWKGTGGQEARGQGPGEQEAGWQEARGQGGGGLEAGECI